MEGWLYALFDKKFFLPIFVLDYDGGGLVLLSLVISRSSSLE
jgi:hypothetical protein